MRVNGVFSSHQSKRAPHLLQADAVASFKRLRLAEALPLSAFLPTPAHNDTEGPSSSSGPRFLSSHMDTAASSSSAADHNRRVQIIPHVLTHHSSPVSEASDTIYDG